MKRLLIFVLPILIGSSSCVTYHYDEPLIRGKKDLLTLSAIEKEDLDFIPSNYRNLMIKLSKDYEISSKLVCAIIEVESNWNEQAIGTNINGTYDIGLVQINSNYVDYYRERFLSSLDPYSALSSIKFCFIYLNWLCNYFDSDVDNAIMAYNIGCGSVRRNERLEIGYNYLEKVNLVLDSL